MDTLAPGTVALVGAGPGDPGLITLRGSRLLAQADVVVYDALSSPRLLRHAPAAEHLYVGKLAARHSMSQDQINALLVERARAGQRVVRLKGGDPFVFGRGGEEAEVLAAAGLKFVVVPGVTAAIAAAAYAGIPVTHRDLNSGFTLLTGHEKEEAYRDDDAKARDQDGGRARGSSDVDWAAVARLPCVAFYMGVKALPRITANLLEHGASPDTPAATIQWGTTARQRTCVATVATIAAAVSAAGIGSPAITIVGRVVGLRDTLNWFETRPLFGQTVIVTRTREQASGLTELLEGLGADVVEVPTIETVMVADTTLVDATLRSVSTPELSPGATRAQEPPDAAASVRSQETLSNTWLVFTSANGVRATKDRMRALGLDSRHLADVKIAVIGEATADAVRGLLSIEPDCVPARFVAEALADELIARGDVAGRRFVLLRAEIARPVLVDRLTAAGATVEDVAVYETRAVATLPPGAADAIDRGVDWVTFTSSSTARNFVSMLGDGYEKLLSGAKIASIGPVTSDTLRKLGLPPTVESAQADVGVLAAAVAGFGAAPRAGGGAGASYSK